jgi:hypothetical protein
MQLKLWAKLWAGSSSYAFRINSGGTIAGQSVITDFRASRQEIRH